MPSWLLRVLAISVTVHALNSLGLTAENGGAPTDGDWPAWRGPTSDGVAAAGQHPPTEWSETENVVWSSPVPGRGHGSPTVVGDQVFLATADEEGETQSVLCYDRPTGELRWRRDVHQGGFPTKLNRKASHASSTPACDGRRLFVNFVSHDAAFTTALDLDGEVLWTQKLTDYVVHQGFGSSPILYDDLVLATADNKGGGAMAAFDRETGDQVWKVERPQTPNYVSPIVVIVAGRPQIVLQGCDRVESFDPVTGERLWEAPEATTECVTSMVTDGQRIFTSGGYPRNHVAAIRGDGTAIVDWDNNTRVYVPSMIVADGYLYAVSDPGFAVCWNCETGEQLWKQRLEGEFTASLVMIGDSILATNEQGRSYLFTASPDGFSLVAENKLGDEAFDTPAVAHDQVFFRVAHNQDGVRQEMLYCIGGN